MPGLLDGIASTEVRSSTVSGTESQFTTGSLTNLRTAGSVVDTEGRFRSISAGSPGLFGAMFQTGSFATDAGSVAAVAFRRNFGAANAYVFWAWPQSGTGLAGAGSLNVYTSGTANNGKNSSGVNVVGGASVTYDYLAAGL